jgi:hypothetical protein
LRCFETFSPAETRVVRAPAAHDFAWFMATWPSLAAETMPDPRSSGVPPAPLFVGSLSPDFSPRRNRDELELALAVELALLPDAGVLEALWLASPDARRVVDEVRESVDSRLRGESYFRDARRALWLLQELEFRGIRHVHVLGNSGLMCGWLLKRLGSLRVTFSTDAVSGNRRVDATLGRELDAGLPPGVTEDIWRAGRPRALSARLRRSRPRPSPLPAIRPVPGEHDA